MAEIGTVTAIFGAIKTALNGLMGLKELGLSAQHSEVVDAAIDQMREAQDRVNTVHGDLIELREENHALRHTIEEHDNWQARLAQYELVQTAGGAQVFQNDNSPDHHYACPACVENQRIGVLQNMQVVSGRWQCPSCSFNYQVDLAY